MQDSSVDSTKRLLGPGGFGGRQAELEIGWIGSLAEDTSRVPRATCEVSSWESLSFRDWGRST